MDIDGMNRIPAKGFRRAGIHRHFSFSYGSKDPACIQCRLFQRYVAMDSADSEKVQGGVVCGK